jgi:hypothetical protein
MAGHFGWEFECSITTVQSILLYGAGTWTLNTQQANKLLATEMDF